MCREKCETLGGHRVHILEWVLPCVKIIACVTSDTRPRFRCYLFEHHQKVQALVLKSALCFNFSVGHRIGVKFFIFYFYYATPLLEKDTMSGSFCNLDICPIVQLSNCPFVRICIYSDFRRAALRITDIYVQLGHLCGKRGYVSLSICVLWLLGVKKDSKAQFIY